MTGMTKFDYSKAGVDFHAYKSAFSNPLASAPLAKQQRVSGRIP